MYKDFPDAELIRAYSTMMDNSGEISNDLKKAIEQRGGMDFFKRKLTFRKSHPEEFLRITNEVQILSTEDNDFEFVRNHITSKYLSDEDLDLFIGRLHLEHQNSIVDRKITKDTIFKSLIGLIVGSIASGLFWWLSLIIFHSPFYFFLPLVYLIAYLIIKFLTKQSSKNPVVLVSSLIAALMGILLGHYLYLS